MVSFYDGLHPSLQYYALTGLMFVGSLYDGLHPSLEYYALTGLMFVGSLYDKLHPSLEYYALSGLRFSLYIHWPAKKGTDKEISFPIKNIRRTLYFG